jgi:hypothetical protein
MQESAQIEHKKNKRPHNEKVSLSVFFLHYLDHWGILEIILSRSSAIRRARAQREPEEQ